MSYYEAIATFRDPSDGELVVAGRTYVAECAEVYRRFPSRFKLLARTRLVERRFSEAPAVRTTRTSSARTSPPRRSPDWFLGDDYFASWRL